MSSFLKIIIASSALATLSACSGGGTSLPGGTQCPANYDPVPLQPNSSQKPVQQNPKQNEVDKIMRPGKYTYKYADIIYSEKSDQRPLKLHLHDFGGSTGASVSQGVICVRNGRAKMGLSLTATVAATDIIVCNDYSQVVQTRTYTFGALDSIVKLDPPQVANSCLTTSEKVAPKAQAVVFKNNDTDFEIRSQQDTDDGKGTYTVAVRLAYGGPIPVNADPPECANKCITPPLPVVAKPAKSR